MLDLLLQLQRFFIPCLIALTIWASFQTIIKKDRIIGVALYISLVIVVDAYLNTGIYIPGLPYGSIRYSELIFLFLFAYAPRRNPSVGVNKLILSLISIYFILLFYSALRGITVLDGLNNFRRIMIPQILAFWIASKSFRQGEDFIRFFFHFMILIVMIGLFTFWDVIYDRIILHSDVLGNAEYWLNRKHGRFGSFFLNPNDLGGFCVLVFPAIFLLALKQRTLLRRLFYWGGFMLFLFAFDKNSIWSSDDRNFSFRIIFCLLSS